MLRRTLLRLGALALGALLTATTATCHAQEGSGVQFTDTPDAEEGESDYHAWVRLEYLFWQLQTAPLPSSLLTNGGSTLYGASQDYGWMSGARLSSCLWYDYNDRVGAEGSFFMFGARSEYSNFSAPTGSGDALPYYKVVNNNVVPATMPLASATQSGSVNFQNDVRFLGGNLDFVFVPVRNTFFELNVLVGFTSVFLKEDYAQNVNTNNTVRGATTTTTATQINDDFDAQNIFYGAELGLRGIFRFEPFFLELTGRIGVGDDDQVVNVSGQTITGVTNSPPATTTTTNGTNGFLAQASNQGSHSQNSLCFMPQFQARIGYNITPNVQLSVGYDYLYLTSVVRPGNQIDQIMGNLNGTTHPIVPMNTSGFFAQGLNIGLEVKF